MDKILAPIKQKIIQYIENKSIVKEDFYKKTGISPSNFKGDGLKSEIGADKLVKILTNYEDLNPDWLLLERGDMLRDEEELENNPLLLNESTQRFTLRTDKPVKGQSIPLYNTNAAAGLTRTFSDKPDIIDYISIPNLPKCDGAIYITGDSMYPLLKSGDIVAYKRITDVANGLFWGEMYLLSFLVDGDDYTMVKFIQKSDKGDEYVKLVSQNQHHQDRDIHVKNITALALIKASIRFNSMN
jgi:phage repressor protein C with HTH and peptisase S24 domain